MPQILFEELFRGVPAYDGAAVRRALDAALASDAHKVVVLDDDPTGVQTVHGVSVFTDWSEESIAEGFAEPGRMFFVLTNSRSFPAGRTRDVHAEIARTVAAVSARAGKPFLLVSRGDSTLRGHYPLETETLRKTLEDCGLPPFDGEIVFPFFPEGGRFTKDAVHYVRQGDAAVPAGETEFARDRTFGFASSDLTRWIEEKTGGQIRADDVTVVPLALLRARQYDAVEALLEDVSEFGKVVVDALQYADAEVFVTALLHVLARGKRFMFRTAAAFAKVLGGVSDRPLLTHAELLPDGAARGGLIVVGSHVRRTTEQLARLEGLPGVETIVLDQHLVLDPPAFARERQRAAEACAASLRAGRTAVVMTRRERLDLATGDPEDELRIAAEISNALVGVVRAQTDAPAFVVAKGGITSSDVGVKGLGVRRAEVLGQIRPGVPVWRTGPESRFPGIPYVVFPGNVGDENDLRRAVEVLRGE